MAAIFRTSMLMEAESLKEAHEPCNDNNSKRDIRKNFAVLTHAFMPGPRKYKRILEFNQEVLCTASAY